MFRNDLSPIYMSLLPSARKHLVPSLKSLFSHVCKFLLLSRETSNVYQVFLIRDCFLKTCMILFATELNFAVQSSHHCQRFYFR